MINAKKRNKLEKEIIDKLTLLLIESEFQSDLMTSSGEYITWNVVNDFNKYGQLYGDKYPEAPNTAKRVLPALAEFCEGILRIIEEENIPKGERTPQKGISVENLDQGLKGKFPTQNLSKDPPKDK